MEENVNKKIIEEIHGAIIDDEIKQFLEEILLDEHAGLIGPFYKDYYKTKVMKYVSKNLILNDN